MNINQLMKQAQMMQKKMEEAQAALAEKEYSGSAGGGMVEVTIDGKAFMKKIKLSKEAIDADEAEMLEDLIVAAFNDAKRRQDEDSQGIMGDLMGGMKMPVGFKGAF